jgi:hypothetical protein
MDKFHNESSGPSLNSLRCFAHKFGLVGALEVGAKATETVGSGIASGMFLLENSLTTLAVTWLMPSFLVDSRSSSIFFLVIFGAMLPNKTK